MAIRLTGSLEVTGSITTNEIISSLPIATSSLALNSEKATNSFDVTGSLHVTDSVNGSRYTSSIQTLSSASGDFYDSDIQNFSTNNYDSAIVSLAVGFDTSSLQVGDKVIFPDPFNFEFGPDTKIFSGSGQIATIHSFPTGGPNLPQISMSFSTPFTSTPPAFGIAGVISNGMSLSIYRNLSNPVSLDNGAEITGSVNVSGSITANEIISLSPIATASLAITATTASYVTTAQTASYIAGANVDGTVASATSATTATTATTASYIRGYEVDGRVDESLSSSYAFEAYVSEVARTASYINAININGEYGNHIIPIDNETYDLGSSSNRWRDLYLSGSTIYLGNQSITQTSYAAISSSVAGKTLISSSEQINALGVTASVATTAATSSYVAASNIDGTVSNATTASYAVTASYALNGGGGGGAAFPHTGSAIITGSLEVTGSTDFSYKKSVAEAWSTSTNLPYNNKFYVSRATGTTTSTLAQQGTNFSGPSLPSCNVSLEYNGATWSNGGTFPFSNTIGPLVGTQNSALSFGFDYYEFIGNCTYLYNGTSWSDTGHAHNCGKGGSGGFGTSNAAVKTGAIDRYGAHHGGVEEYNGSSWTVVNPLPSAQGGQGSAGTQNAGVIFGCMDGLPGFQHSSGTTTTLEYNGSTWSTGGSLSKARHSPGSAKNGTQNSTLAVSGVYGNFASCTEKYNGATWSSAANFPGTSRSGVGGSGDSTSALAFGGSVGYTATNNSYEYTGAAEEQVSNLSTDNNGIIKMTELGANLNFADDSAAATGGIPIGGLYHTSGTIKIRLT